MTTDLLDPETCLAKVRARDRAADGSFVYGVVTTGVYCRPSCAARPAKAENMRFFARVEEAEAIGLRPCLRCRPNDQAQDAALAEKIARYIDAHADEPLPLARLAAVAGVSPSAVQRAFKAALGVTPKAYQDAARLRRLKANLKAQDGVAGAIFDAGYGSTSRVYEQADGRLGMTPSAYRSGGAGETIAFACRETAFGLLMMAATARGVCFVQFGDSEDALLAQLEREFPNAARVPADAAAAPLIAVWMQALDAHLSAGGPRPEVPLDVRGTAFQIRVWRFLQSVKEGDAISYAELAQAIGAPKAVRAAASACARNTIAVLIPCHRVLRGDGSLGGYRWGLARKRALLDLERARRAEDRA